jgi:hypothetical protein
MGSCAELCATHYQISREEMDDHAIEAFQRAQAAAPYMQVCGWRWLCSWLCVVCNICTAGEPAAWQLRAGISVVVTDPWLLVHTVRHTIEMATTAVLHAGGGGSSAAAAQQKGTTGHLARL